MAVWQLFTKSDYKYSGLQKQLLEQVDRDSNDRAGRVLASPEELSRSVKQLEYRLTKHKMRTRFEHRRRTGIESKLPRAHIWRTYRLSEGAALLGVVSLRASEAFSVCEVDVFLATEFSQLGRLEVTRQLMLFVLADAIRCGTSLAVAFTKQGCDNTVPTAVLELAREHGVELAHVSAGAISPSEATELFLRLSGFRSSVIDRIRELDSDGLVSIARVCYLRASGIWTLCELEFLLTHSPFPELPLAGRVLPEHDHLFVQAMSDARSAVMASMMHQRLSRQDGAPDSQPTGTNDPAQTAAGREIVERGGYELLVRWDFHDPNSADSLDTFNVISTCCAAQPVHLPGWTPICNESNETGRIPARTVLRSQICGLDMPSLASRLSHEWTRVQQTHPTEAISQIVLPYDFHLLPTKTRSNLLAQVNERVRVAVCPVSCAKLDELVQQKIQQGEFVRS